MKKMIWIALVAVGMAACESGPKGTITDFEEWYTSADLETGEINADAVHDDVKNNAERKADFLENVKDMKEHAEAIGAELFIYDYSEIKANNSEMFNVPEAYHADTYQIVYKKGGNKQLHYVYMKDGKVYSVMPNLDADRNITGWD